MTFKDPHDAFVHGVDLRAAADAAWAEPQLQTATKATGRSPATWRDHAISAAALQKQTFPPVSFVIDGIIPEGLSILAGRPKVGKSWLALELAIAAAAKRLCLGGRRAADGDVLYCALEDNPRRLQRRIDKILGAFANQWPERLTLATTWQRLDKGGVGDIEQWADSVPNPRLVILDTLAGVRPVRTNNGYSEDYESLAELHRLANERGLAILVLHHTRKMEAEDPIDTISGTLGLAGCADTALVIARSSQGTTLYVRGRDIEEAEHAVTFDKATCRWAILGAAAEVHRSDIRRSILATLEKCGESMTPAEVAAELDADRNTIKQRLHQMFRDGEVEKAGNGRYRHPQGSHNQHNRVTDDDV